MDLETLFRTERPRALATLVRLVGDLDLAEDALQEACAVAIRAWPRGAPANPRAWLVSTARFKAIDRLRRDRRLGEKLGLVAPLQSAHEEPPPVDESPIADDQLRLVFTCCHPALSPEARIALTLKTLCGLTVDEIARAFLVPKTTMAQRLVRAKEKIRLAKIPYAVPAARQLGERLETVLRVVYLVFTEGYAATAGEELVRRELTREAIRLARLLHQLLPTEPEVGALLALLLLQDARRGARLDAAGDLVTLGEQDRSRWDARAIAEGVTLVRALLPRGGPGFYSLQAAIAAVHAEAPDAEQTDWRQIAALYDLLARHHPSPVIELNRAVAIAMARGPEHGLELLEALERRGELAGFHLLSAARAELLTRLGRLDEAARAFERAIAQVAVDAERRHLERRLRALSTAPG